MKTASRLQTLAALSGGVLLLGAALTAWGINITLNDGTNSVTCATSGNATIGANGDINATVTAGSTCDLSGGGEPPPPPPPGSFTLSVTKTGFGTVTSSPAGIDCGSDCSEPYPEGTAVSLTATPDTGSTFGGWSGACTGTGPCNLSMTVNRSVTATFALDGGGGDCGPLPPDVTVVDTGNIQTAWPQQTRFPLPAAIEAFRVTVPSGLGTTTTTFNSGRTSAGERAKLLVVSTCPGVLQPVGGQSRCLSQNPNETNNVKLTTSTTDNFRCRLAPGTYYVNAVSKSQLTDTGFTCTNTTNCSHVAVRN